MVSLDEMGEKTSEIEDLSKNEVIVAEGTSTVQSAKTAFKSRKKINKNSRKILREVITGDIPTLSCDQDLPDEDLIIKPIKLKQRQHGIAINTQNPTIPINKQSIYIQDPDYGGNGADGPVFTPEEIEKPNISVVDGFADEIDVAVTQKDSDAADTVEIVDQIEIPDEETIEILKKQRRVKAQEAESFVPLQSTKQDEEEEQEGEEVDAADGPQSNYDDFELEGLQFQDEDLALSDKAYQTAQIRNREKISQLLDEAQRSQSIEAEDEDLDWEKDQIKSGAYSGNLEALTLSESHDRDPIQPIPDITETIKRLRNTFSKYKTEKTKAEIELNEAKDQLKENQERQQEIVSRLEKITTKYEALVSK